MEKGVGDHSLFFCAALFWQMDRPGFAAAAELNAVVRHDKISFFGRPGGQACDSATAKPQPDSGNP